MSTRKEIFANKECYHIFSRSIAGYKVFNGSPDYSRFINQINLHRYKNFTYKYSQFIDLDLSTQSSVLYHLAEDNDVFVQIVAFCIMPTHFHLILQQEADDGVVKFMGRILNSYSKYFNQKYKRNGPLWSSRFKSVRVSTDDQLLHLTRYLHLNPTSAGLVNKPEEWQYSSYCQYIQMDGEILFCCDFQDLLETNPEQYKKFVEDRKGYQRDLSIIKKTIIDDYTC